jgi:type IV pilus assembly protein PilY1
MYKLKLVLWEILNDPGLVSGLRMGLATYYQQGNDPPEVPSIGVYYQWPPTDRGQNQALSWEGSSSWNRALLRRFFKSTDEPGSIEEITKWVDGIEASDNPELRAHGATPLAASIYGADAHPNKDNPYRGDARDFFLMSGAINAWCQQNWLIVLTDGADTQTWPYDTSPVTAVKNLYDEHTKTSWPSFYGNKAQPVRTMVIGLINPNASGVSTLKNTLNRMADMGDDGQENGSSHAYFATDVDELMQAFKDIFKQIQSFNSTANAPLVSPPIGGQEGGVYVPNFVPRIERQWYGHFYKYVLSTEGVMSESPQWDAASKLDAKSYSARNVFTVNWKGGSWKMDFKDINAQSLAPMLGLTQDQASKFIKWALGSDEWDEDTRPERYKLGDIYHSGLVEIGPPRGSNPHGDYRTFKENNANREKLVYVQANDGMLHAFEAETGEEKWAFIPPNVLAEGRMTGMKQDLTKSGNTITVMWLDKAKSNPRYLLDGTMTAEDVLLSDGKYHTVLLGLLGYAGPGFYALDVTDPDEPQFMWAVENVIYNRTGDELLSNKNTEWYVSYWARSGGSAARTNILHKDITDSSDLNYKELRLTQSTPGIGYVSVPNGTLPNTWVAIMGNGSQMGINDASSVASVYVINIENGKLLKVLGGSSMKQIVTPAAILWTGSTRLVKYFYVGDDNGKIYEGDLTNSQPSEWEMRDVFSIKSSVGPSYILDCAYIDRNKWLFINTGDYETLMRDKNKTDYMIAVNISLGVNNMNDLAQLTSAAGSVSTNVKGWYMEIPKDEYATTPPVYYNGHIFFSTYIKSEDPCSVGKSRIYVLNATTGKGAWTGGAKYVEMEGVKVSGIVISEGRVYAGVTKYPQAQTTIPGDLKVGEEAAVIQNGLLVFDVPPEVANWDSAYPSGVMVPSYWRRWIP